MITTTPKNTDTATAFIWRQWPQTGLLSFISPVGILFAGAFFAMALTPSLLPRDPLLQGVLVGIAAALGHEIGVLLSYVWRFFGLPTGSPIVQAAFAKACVFVGVLGIIFGLSHATEWQNMSRLVVGLPLLERVAIWQIFLIGSVIFVALWCLARGLVSLTKRLGRVLNRFLPVRVSVLVAIIAVIWFVSALTNGVIGPRVLALLDASFAADEQIINPEHEQPQIPERSGSPDSLVAFADMGHRGREFVATAPTKAEIEAFTGEPALDPVRIYVGRASADTAQERADIALADLIRAGGFDRKILVVMVPVGTGWMDPGAHDTLDFMFGGDVATVAAQYSYLTSVLSLIVEPEYGVEQSIVLFDTIYSYWEALPADNRPELYVHGLSQGAFNMQRAVPLLDILGDPINGAMWAGSPFFSTYWSQVRDNREPESPAWRPAFGNGSLARSLNQDGTGNVDFAEWGPIRFVFLNYGSDPIVNFTFDSLWQRPDWLYEPRAPDVSPDLHWYPIVTAFQLGLDSVLSLQVERFGHYYIAPDYIDAWALLTSPPDWNEEKANELKAIFVERGPAF